jgi:hypothetical protein
MAFTHTNKVRYNYISGSVNVLKEVTKVETAGAEMNVSEAITTDGSTEAADIDLEYFEFTHAVQAKSVYLRLDGFNGAIYANGSSAGTKMVDLDDGEPYVWSYGGGTNFPPGNTNPMKDDTLKLTVKPDAGAGTTTAGTITASVLYDPTA